MKGKHVIEAVADLTGHSNFTTNSANSRGTFTFNGTYTGNAYADFLTGIPVPGRGDHSRATCSGYYTRQFEPFVQDSWKVTPRLTLNFGVRYSYFFRPWAMHNVLSSVDPAANRIVVASESDGTIRMDAQQVAKYVFPLFSDIIVPVVEAGGWTAVCGTRTKRTSRRGSEWRGSRVWGSCCGRGTGFSTRAPRACSMRARWRGQTYRFSRTSWGCSIPRRRPPRRWRTSSSLSRWERSRCRPERSTNLTRLRRFRISSSGTSPCRRCWAGWYRRRGRM